MLRISSNVGNVAPLKTHSLLHSAQEDKGSQAKDSKNKNEEWWNIPYTPSPHGTVGFYTLNRMHPYLYLLVFCTATAGGPKCRMLTIPRSLELQRLYIVRLLYHFRDPFRARFNACGFRFRRHKLDQHDQLRLIKSMLILCEIFHGLFGHLSTKFVRKLGRFCACLWSTSSKLGLCYLASLKSETDHNPKSAVFW